MLGLLPASNECRFADAGVAGDEKVAVMGHGESGRVGGVEGKIPAGSRKELL
jgi:hypothetical protein